MAALGVFTELTGYGLDASAWCTKERRAGYAGIPLGACWRTAYPIGKCFLRRASMTRTIIRGRRRAKGRLGWLNFRRQAPSQIRFSAIVSNSKGAPPLT